MALGAGHTQGTPTAAGHTAPKMPSALPHSHPAPAAPHPSANSSSNESGRAAFFSNAPIPNPTLGNNTCTVYSYFGGSYHYCYNSTTEPSLNLTTQGYTGLAYTAFTNNSPCASTVPYAVTEVGFVVSTDFGFTWSTPSYLGNPVCSGVPDQNYSSAFQPSLTSLANGTFVLSYVEYNSSGAYFYYQGPPSTPSCGYVNSTRIVVTESYDNGATWTTPQVLTAAEFNASTNSCPMDDFPSVRPRLAAIGDTVYLTWFDMTNPPYYYLQYGSQYAESAWFTASIDGGQTWGTPTAMLSMPGDIYGTPTDIATNPTPLVDPSGRLYVAYATNYGLTTICDQYCGSYYSASILLAISTDNGSTFSISHPADNVLWNFGNYYPPTFTDPMPTMAYNPVFDQVYLAYSGAIEGNYCYNQGPYGVYCYQQSVANIEFQNSSDHGVTWSTPSHLRPVSPVSNWQSPAYNPSMAVDSSGRVQLQYALEDESICVNITTPFITYYCAPTQEIYVNSTDNGTTWTSPLIVSGEYTLSYGPYREIWDGTFTSTLAAGSQVLLGWSRVLCPTISTTGCYLPAFSFAPSLPPQSCEVVASRLYMGAGVTVTFNETNAPTGSIWSVNIQGNIRFGPAGDNLSISGVPPSSAITWYAPWINASYGDSFFPAYSLNPPSAFATNTVVLVSFSEQVLVNLLVNPPGIPSYYFLYTWASNYNLAPGPGGFWTTAGTPQTFTATPVSPLYIYCYACTNFTFLSWTGTGAGSVTSTQSSITFTPTGPVNETANFAINGVCWGSFYVTYYGYGKSCFNYTYSLSFAETGLPLGTDWGVTVTSANGTSVTNTSTAPFVSFDVSSGINAFAAWTIPDPLTGEFWVPTTSIQSPVAVPQASTIVVSYSLQPLSSASFSTSFRESGLPNGTAWALQVGPDSFGLAASNGSFSLQGGSTSVLDALDVYLSNGTAYYAQSIDITPLVINETSYSIAPGATYVANGSAIVTVVYSPMYRLTVSSSVGGDAAPASTWVPFGQGVTLGETPWPGYYFVGWTGTGTGSATTGTANPIVSPRGPVTELATFRPTPPPTWNITVAVAGLPAGTPFSVTIGTATYTGTAGFAVGSLTDGMYALSAPTVSLNSSDTTRFVPTSLQSTLPFSGGFLNVSADGTVTITYATQYVVSVIATPGGSVSGGSGTVWANSTDLLTLTATPDAHYAFVAWNGTGPGSVTSTASSISFTPGGPATETAQFVYRPTPPPATFWLQVTQTGLPSGVSWSIAAGGLGASGTNGTLTVMGLNGSYLLTAPTVYGTTGVRWISNVSDAPANVVQNGTYTIAFQEQYLVTVLTGTGGSVTPSTEWVNAGATVTIAATANASSQFLVWNGTGAGSYNGTSATHQLTVLGPVIEQASFGSIPGKGQGGQGTSDTGGALTSIGLLIALLVVGAIVGILLGRRRGGASAAPMQEEPAEPAGSETMEGAEAPSSTIYGEDPPAT